jgi:hypothetical protein
MDRQIIIMKHLIVLVFLIMFPLAQATETIWTGLDVSGGCYTSIGYNLLGCSRYHFGDNATITNVTFVVHTCATQDVRFFVETTGYLWDSGVMTCGCPPWGVSCHCEYTFPVNAIANVSGDYDVKYYGAGRVINYINTTGFPVYPLGHSSGSNYLSGICGWVYINGIQQLDFVPIVPTTTTTIPRRCVIMDCSGLRGFPMGIIGFLCSSANFLFCFPLILGVMIVAYVVYRKLKKK